MFGIEEEQYDSDYISQLTQQLDSEMPKEEKMQRFKRMFESWTEKLESAKKLVPTFRDDVARRVVNMELSRIEVDLGLYDVLSEADCKVDDYFKIQNVFVSLWAKLAAVESDLKTKTFDQILIFGEVPYNNKKDTPPLGSGDYEMMIGRILPILRDLYDTVEIITLISKFLILLSHECPLATSGTLQQEIDLLQVVQRSGFLLPSPDHRQGSLLVDVDRLGDHGQHLHGLELHLELLEQVP